MATIDARVEPLAREVMAAAAKKDPERFQRALLVFPDDDSIIKGIRLATAVSLVILHDVHEGRSPTGTEVAEFAVDIAAAEKGWTDVTSDEVLKYLTAACGGVELTHVMPMGRVIILAYVIATNLVGSYRDDNEPWWDYLDRVEAIIESTPED